MASAEVKYKYMKRLGVVALFGLVFRLVLLPATPAISNITVTTDTNVAVVRYNVSPDSYCWVRYGVASGTYLWNSATFSSTTSPGLCSMPINGLKDNTTYYFLPTARPNPDDETNICATPDCGAVEQKAVTPDVSTSHLPAEPVSVAANLLSEPDTSGYAIVNLVEGGPRVNHECIARDTVKAPAGYSWTILRGETLTRIIAEHAMTYGTIYQVPHGLTCVVNPSYAPWGAGYNLPVLGVDPLATEKSMDAPNHRWIIFRTTPGATGELPPFGARTGPSFFSHYGGFQGNTPNSVNGYNSGTIFNQASGQLHHYWFENLKFSVDENRTEANYDYFIVFGNGEGGGTPPFCKYIVMRGNYFHGPNRANVQNGTPSVQGAIAGTMQGQIAIVGNYFDNLYYAKGALGSGIVQGIYFMDCGNAGTCNTGGPALIDNNYMHGMAMNLYLESNNPNNPAVPHDFTVTHNSFHWPYDTTYPYSVAVGTYGCRNQIEYKGMIRSRISGNYINGQWACGNSGAAILMSGYGTITDVTIKSNYITKATTVLNIAGLGNANSVVSHYSTANRFLVTNNLAENLGRGLYQAGGGGLGTSFLDMDTSATNVIVTNNTVGPFANQNGTIPGYWYPWIFNYSGGGTGQLAGFTMQNNILPFGVPSAGPAGAGIDTQGVIYGNGVLSHPATPLPANSFMMSPLNYAKFLGTIAGYTDGSPGLGMQGASVISGGSGYPSSGNLAFSGCTTAPVGSYTAKAGVIVSTTFTSFGSGCDPTKFKVTPVGGGSGALLRPAYGLKPSFQWNSNVNYCTTFNQSDMDMMTCLTASATMPAGDVYAPGPNTAARMAAAGIVNGALSDYHCKTPSLTACVAGANVDTLEADLGIVSHISTSTVGTTFTISYLAPDSKGCSVDISPDQGIGWMRKADTPGERQRSVVLDGLAPNTSYQYRVLCYFDQTPDWFAFPSDTSNLTTSGTFTTGGGARGPRGTNGAADQHP